MEKLLTDCKVGQTLTIVKINEQNTKLLHRYAELGLICGQQIQVVCVAPKKSAILVAVRGFSLAIDKDVCNKVVVDGQ